MSDTGIVKIHGKDYQTVALRTKKFREDWGSEYGIKSSLLHHDETRVVMKSEIVSIETGNVVATGHAEETRDGRITTTAAMEVAETSAVGRALAFFMYAGSEIASADEMSADQLAKQLKAYQDTQLEHMNAVRDHMDSIMAIQQHLSLASVHDVGTALWEMAAAPAAEAWFELDDAAKAALWRSTTTGGIFTTKERATLKLGEFKKLFYGESE